MELSCFPLHNAIMFGLVVIAVFQAPDKLFSFEIYLPLIQTH